MSNDSTTGSVALDGISSAIRGLTGYDPVVLAQGSVVFPLVLSMAMDPKVIL